MLLKNSPMMCLVGLITIMETLPLLCDDFSLFFSYSVMCSCAIGDMCMFIFALLLQSICNKKKTLKQKMGFFIYIYIFFFFSLYVPNYYLFFIHHRPVFCKFDQTLVFFSLSPLYTYIN